ncbi:MAG: hypothetical protein NTY15_07095 [Planctomycetota bacterium]|jgi:hypothetical protein|nr:hypothetical protein [Planctomycetota bacterium]
MTSARPGNLTIPVCISLPSILIVIGFLWFCYLPSQRLIQSKRVEMEKRLANNAKSPKSPESLTAKLNSVQLELVKIAQECESLSQLQESIIARRSQWLRDSSPGNSPAKTVASTLELFRQNNLSCIESGLIGSPQQKEERFVSVHSKTSAPSTSPSENHSKTKYRIRVQGRFQDVRKALLQLQEEHPSVILQSIDMEASDPQSDHRIWTLLLNI